MSNVSKLKVKPGFLIFDADKGTLQNDSICAESVASKLHNELAYSASAKAWHQFVGTHWQAVENDEEDKPIFDMIKSGSGGHGFSANLFSNVKKLIKAGGLLALKEYEPRYIVPMKNGLLNIETMELLPITPQNALTWSIPYDYSPDANCPEIMSFLNHATGGNPEMNYFLLCYMAAIVQNVQDLQIFLHLKGDPSAGKGTFIRLLQALAGAKNTAETNLVDLENNRFETAKFYKKRLIIIPETTSKNVGTSVLMRLTGGDEIRMEKKGVQQTGGFKYNGQLVIASNEYITTSDKSAGLDRRRRTVSFNAVVTDKQKADWKRRGGEENILHPEIPGLIVRLLRLSHDDIRKVLRDPPQATKEENLKAMASDNPIIEWALESVIVESPAETVIGNLQKITEPGQETIYAKHNEHLFPNYLQWCQRNGRFHVPKKSFSEIFERTINAIQPQRVTVLTSRNHGNVLVARGARLRAEGEKPQFL